MSGLSDTLCSFVRRDRWPFTRALWQLSDTPVKGVDGCSCHFPEHFLILNGEMHFTRLPSVIPADSRMEAAAFSLRKVKVMSPSYYDIAVSVRQRSQCFNSLVVVYFHSLLNSFFIFSFRFHICSPCSFALTTPFTVLSFHFLSFILSLLNSHIFLPCCHLSSHSLSFFAIFRLLFYVLHFIHHSLCSPFFPICFPQSWCILLSYIFPYLLSTSFPVLSFWFTQQYLILLAAPWVSSVSSHINMLL